MEAGWYYTTQNDGSRSLFQTSGALPEVDPRLELVTNPIALADLNNEVLA